MTSPCFSCQTSPCCSHLELTSFPIRTQAELDQALYFSNFSNIDTTLSADWRCTAYFLSRCKNLTAEGGCAVHNQPEQPLICVNYSPYKCFYSKTMTNKAEPKADLLWMDSQRWLLLQQWLYSEQEALPFYPAWQEVQVRLLRSIYQGAAPYQQSAAIIDTPYANWLIWAEGQTQQLPVVTKYNLAQYRSICNSCSSWCCTFLSVPLKQPTEFKDIDYIRYCLNFEGTQVAITDAGWSLLVKTTCRHLQNNQCSIYQQPERPRICRYYPEQDCYYRKTIAQPNTAQYLRLAQAEFELMTDLFHFQEQGQLFPLPDVAGIKAHVEQQLAESAEA